MVLLPTSAVLVVLRTYVPLVSASSTAHGYGKSPFTESPSLPNTHIHKAVPRQLVTGAHTVSDVSCAFCGNVLGWKYVAAEEESQRYKVGKFILETKKVAAVTFWEGSQDHGQELPPVALDAQRENPDNIEFDSQDEDECEELFAGVWSPTVAAARRRAKKFGKDGMRS